MENTNKMNRTCSHCDKTLMRDEQVVRVRSDSRTYLFCSIGCRDRYDFRDLNHRICAREACSNRVPKKNRMLCPSCYQKGRHLGEPEASFDEAERAHWSRMDQALHRRIEQKVRIYSSEDMSQESLRALVPSMHEKAA